MQFVKNRCANKMIRLCTFYSLHFFTFFLFSLFHLGLSLQAQVVNIENKRIYDDTVGWSGNVTGVFSALRNNDLLYSVNFRPTAQYKTEKQNYFLIGDFIYSKGQERVYANAGLFHFRFAQRIKKSPWKWESYTQIQYNELRDQAFRGLLGTGLRWKVYDKNNWKVFLGTSTFYEIEEIRTTKNIDRDIRWSNYLSWFIDPKTFFTFTGATYFQPMWENFGDYRVLGQYTLSFVITKNFNIKTDFTFFHDTQPPDGVPKTTFSTMFGFGFRIK